MKIALGTVQMGLAYGVANTAGCVAGDEAAAILSLARSRGVDTLDTAAAYGDSEARLGEAGVDGWRIVTKLRPVPADAGEWGAWATREVQGSLARLRQPRLYGLLLHRPEQLLDPQGGALYDAMRRLGDEGVVEKIGVSVYDPAELDALAGRFAFDLVQAPFSVFDQRLLTSGWLSRLVDRGIELHARSVFLQGLLLMPPAARPAWADRWAPLWRQYDGWVTESRLTPLEACLRHALAVPEIARVVVGVDSVAQLREILDAAGGAPPPQAAMLAASDPRLINPSLWEAR